MFAGLLWESVWACFVLEAVSPQGGLEAAGCISLCMAVSAVCCIATRKHELSRLICFPLLQPAKMSLPMASTMQSTLCAHHLHLVC